LLNASNTARHRRNYSTSRFGQREPLAEGGRELEGAPPRLEVDETHQRHSECECRPGPKRKQRRSVASARAPELANPRLQPRPTPLPPPAVPQPAATTCSKDYRHLGSDRHDLSRQLLLKNTGDVIGSHRRQRQTNALRSAASRANSPFLRRLSSSTTRRLKRFVRRLDNRSIPRCMGPSDVSEGSKSLID
jgi:hypothetical protein